MNSSHSSHEYAEASRIRLRNLRGEDYHLNVKQQPIQAKLAIGKEKDRKPVDPPPIVQLRVPRSVDPRQDFIHSPYYFMSCTLMGKTDDDELPARPVGTYLAGNLVSSLHRLKDETNEDGAFFIFGDLSLKLEGEFRLHFTLHEVDYQGCTLLASITSSPFTVYPQKNFPGLGESTFLTRAFSDQGVRLRLRKEPRTLLRKRGPASDDYQPRTYRKDSRQHQQGAQGQNTGSLDSNRQSVDTLNSMPLPGQYPPLSYSADPMQREYSQTSMYNGYRDESMAVKRPRTGSEQSPVYSQHEVLGNTQYTPSFTDPFSTQQPPSYSYPYTQSPIPNTPPFNMNQQQSPQSPFYPQQTHNVRYPQHSTTATTLSQRSLSGPPAFDNFAMNTRTQMPLGVPVVGINSMSPPMFGRMSNIPHYAPLSSTPGFGDYPTTTAAPENMLGTRGPFMGGPNGPGY